MAHLHDEGQFGCNSRGVQNPVFWIEHSFQPSQCIASTPSIENLCLSLGLTYRAQIKYLGLHYCYIYSSLALPKTKGLFSPSIIAKKQTVLWASLLSKNKNKSQTVPEHTPPMSPNPCISKWSLLCHCLTNPQAPPHANWKRKQPGRFFFLRSHEKLVFCPLL